MMQGTSRDVTSLLMQVISIAKQMQLEEKAMHRVEMAKHQSLRDEHDKTDSEKVFALKEKMRVAEQANKLQDAQLKA
jgi:hypothetical protein